MKRRSSLIERIADFYERNRAGYLNPFGIQGIIAFIFLSIGMFILILLDERSDAEDFMIMVVVAFIATIVVCATMNIIVAIRNYKKSKTNNRW